MVGARVTPTTTRVAVATALAILLFAGLVPTGTAQSDPWTLAPGDTWTYRGVWTYGETSMAAEETREVEAHETIDVGGEPMAALRVGSTFFMGDETGGTRTEDQTWVDPTNLALLRSWNRARPTVGGEEQPASETLTTYDEPCEQYVWPLVVGERWTRTCTKHHSDPQRAGGGESTVAETTVAEVVGSERVTVPAGTFETVVVRRTTDEGTLREWLSAEACGVVRATMDFGHGSELTMALERFACASAAAIGSGAPAASHARDEEGHGTPVDERGLPLGPWVALFAVAFAAAKRRRA